MRIREAFPVAPKKLKTRKKFCQGDANARMGYFEGWEFFVDCLPRGAFIVGCNTNQEAYLGRVFLIFLSVEKVRKGFFFLFGCCARKFIQI